MSVKVCDLRVSDFLRFRLHLLAQLPHIFVDSHDDSKFLEKNVEKFKIKVESSVINSHIDSVAGRVMPQPDCVSGYAQH